MFDLMAWAALIFLFQAFSRFRVGFHTKLERLGAAGVVGSRLKLARAIPSYRK